MAESQNNDDGNLLPDKPINNPRDDRLDFAPFAQHLAESICLMAPVEGMVMSIYGPWGSGKSSLVNLIIHYLEEKPEDERPIIVHFNPWWFSGQEDLTRFFFGQLHVTFSKWKVKRKELLNKIADLADALAESPIPYGHFGKPAGKILRRKDKDIPAAKEQVAEILVKQDRLILVVIDDIDRLTVEEIRQLFRLIKAVADFPNVLYVLAFDKDAVIKALHELQGIPGNEYLEKIIQVPFELPLPDKLALRRLFFEKLDIILADTPEELFDETYWANVFYSGIDHFLDTPRDIVRLTNAIKVTYPAVKGDVNPIDFIAIEMIRICYPFLYDLIRKHQESFAGHADFGLDRSIEDSKKFHNSWVEQIKEQDRKAIKKLMVRLFPKLEAVWGNVHYGSDFCMEWRKQYRVCSPDVLPVYFKLSVPEGRLSRAEIQEIIDLTKDKDKFSALLVDLAHQKKTDGTTRVRDILEYLQDYTDKDIPEENILPMVSAFYTVGDQLMRPEDKKIGLLEFGNELRMARIVRQLIRRLEEERRFQILRVAIAGGDSVAIIVDEVAGLGQEHGKYSDREPLPETDRIVNEVHLAELEGLALGTIREAAQNSKLLGTPHLPGILYRWLNWADEKEVHEWVANVTEQDIGLIIFLSHFLQTNVSQSLSNVVGKASQRLDPEWIKPFMDPDIAMLRMNNMNLADMNLSESQRVAIAQFTKEYELRKQGKNP